MLALFRLPLVLLNALAGLTGFALAGGRPGLPAMLTAAAILLLAAGASALNQVQEAQLDRRMQRTASRAVAAGRLGRRTALLAALVPLVAGTALLARLEPRAAQAGLLALLLYNGLYTPLKRHTPLALLPGAAAGALPPVIGGLAAGGALTPLVGLLAGLMLLWQLPHFWLLAWRYRDDYRRAGLPCLHDLLTPSQLRRVALTWLLCLLPGGLLLLAFDVPASLAAKLALLLVLPLFPWLLWRRGMADDRALRRGFIQLNALLAGLLLLLLFDRWFFGGLPW